MQFLEKNGRGCDWQMFFFISEGFEDFSEPKAITDSPFKDTLTFAINMIH